MANSIHIKWSGFKEVDDVLKNLPKKINRKVLVSAQREVLKPVAKDMLSTLQSVSGRVTGNLEESVGIKALRGGKEHFAASMAGVRYGNRYKGFHGRFFEQGTKERRPRRSKFLVFKGKDGQLIFVKKAAPMKRKPFIEPTISRHMPRIEREYPDAIMNSLVRYMKKTLK